MKKSLFILISVLFLGCVESFSQPEKPATALTLKVTGFEDNSGQALLLLYRKTDAVPTKPFRQIKVPVTNKESVIPVADLPFGEYAAIVVHDLNKNGIIDHKWGFPAEPLGYTNQWKLSLFSGMPTFEKLKFSYTGQNNIVRVKMSD